MKKCVILAAGPVSDYAALKSHIAPGDFIICADGGTKHLAGFGVGADVVMGDFDSYDGRFPPGARRISYSSHKDQTDTLLAVEHGFERGFRQFAIFGGLGGRLDHTYANLCVLYRIARKGGEGVLYDGENEVYLLPAGELRLPRREGYYVSVFPLGLQSRGVTEKGMKYSLSGALLTADDPLGVSNEFLEEQAVISVEEGPLLVILSKK